MSTGPKPKGPQPKGPQKKSGGVKVPSTGSGGNSTRRTLIAMGIAGLIVVAAALGYALLGSGGGSSSDAIKQLEDAGCTVQKVAALPSGDHSVLTPDGTSKKWNTDPPTSGPHYQQWAIWGAYTDAAQPGAGRAQPRARRHLHPVRPGRAAGDGRPAEDVLRPASERDDPCPAAEARSTRSRWACGRRAARRRRTPAPPTSRSARRSTRRPSPRSSRRTSSRARSASRPTRSRPATYGEPGAGCRRRTAMPGLGVEPRRPEGHPILSRARMTSFATPA